MKTILIAGGSGTRLRPTTLFVNKHLLPIYNKPLIFYPMTLAVLSNSSSITITTNPESRSVFEALIEEMSAIETTFNIVTQPEPRGIADAIMKAIEREPDSSAGTLVLLGDNISYGPGLGTSLQALRSEIDSAVCFSVQVPDPERFGVVYFDRQGKPERIIEKPEKSSSNWAVIGIYYFPSDLKTGLETLSLSARGELEVVDLLNWYLRQNRLKVVKLPRGITWLDAGTPDSIQDASNFVQHSERREGRLIGSPHEAAYHLGLLSDSYKNRLLSGESLSDYEQKMKNILKNGKNVGDL